MRREVCEIKETSQIEDILRRCTVGRLATNGEDGYPYTVPLNYVYWNDAIYFHCSHKGEKIDNLKRDPMVCFEVDVPLAYLDSGYFGKDMPPCNVTQFAHSVIIKGKAELITNEEEKVGALNALMVAHEPGKKFSNITPQMKAVAACAVVVIRIKHMTGKSILSQSKSAKERAAYAAYLRERNLPKDHETADLLER